MKTQTEVEEKIAELTEAATDDLCEVAAGTAAIAQKKRVLAYREKVALLEWVLQ